MLQLGAMERTSHQKTDFANITNQMNEGSAEAEFVVATMICHQNSQRFIAARLKFAGHAVGEMFCGRRFVYTNTWRDTTWHPIESSHLAGCDETSVVRV